MSALRSRPDIQQAVFGPFYSRRFGKSLGVNPLPSGARLCNFDCIYCECSTSPWPLDWELRPQFPTAQQIHDALVSAADSFGSDELDSITITGNGEPTLAPHLDEIVDVVTAARDRDWPQARTVILTNGTMCHKAGVRSALAKLDQRAVKLDCGSNWMLDQLNRPNARLSMNDLVRRISMLPDVIIQSIFVRGPIDNTARKEIETWCGWLERISPICVQIYSLDREPAKNWVRPVGCDQLEAIAGYVQSTLGIQTQVYS